VTDRPDIDLVSGDFWGRNPHAEMTWMRQNQPVYFDVKNGIWAITKYAHVKEASTNPKLFSSAGGIRPETGPIPMMIDMDDPAHVRRRKLVNRGFTPNRVKEQEAFLQHISDELIDQVAERGECDFVWDVAAWLPLIVIGNALGFAREGYPELLKWSDAMLSGLGQGDPSRLEEVTAAFTGYTTYIAGVIADRRENPGDDMISTLIHAEVDGDRLDDDSLIHESLLILIGGDETTRHVMTGGLYQLLSDREQWERLRADRSLLNPAIEEMLRWVSPIKNMARTVTQDIDWHGASLKEGQKVLLLYPSANRDEDVYDDPFRFDMARTPNDHVAFGFGTHYCLGQALARLELRVLFDRLLDRLPDLRLVDESEPTHRPANFVSGYENMKVAFTPTTRIGATA
jgi:cytochrome P450 family 142 subfamily A polypeptide 1